MRVWVGVAAALGLLTIGAPAGAANWVSTYQGTVFSGADFGADFGPYGASLTGESFSISLTWDDTLGVTNSSGNIAGGPANGFSDPLVSATVTINGSAPVDLTRFQWAQSTSNYVYVDSTDTPVAYGSDASVIDSHFNGLGIFADGYPGVFSSTNGLFSGTSPGSCVLYRCSTLNLGDGTNLQLAVASFSVSGVDLTPDGVPEPAEWTLLIIGAGLIGSRLRVRRAQPTLGAV
jgi:hypothetical protein